MAKKPNYRFEKTERERKKAAKKAEKAERAKAKADADATPGTEQTAGATDVEDEAPRPKLSLWPK